jgi:hypothetical protein
MPEVQWFAFIAQYGVSKYQFCVCVGGMYSGRRGFMSLHLYIRKM